MAAQHHDVDDPEMDINPFTMFPLQDYEQGEFQDAPPEIKKKRQQVEHFLSSINSTLVINQLPSEGLSFQLWPAATTFVTFLDRHSSDPCPTINGALSGLFQARDNNVPLRILELGSGTGLVGIAAAAILGANVTVTDLPHVLPNLQFNIEANAGILEVKGGAVNAAALSWGDIEQMEAIGKEYDYILASDVVYHDHLFEPLLVTLKWFLLGNMMKKIVFVMAHLKRWKKESAFFNKAKRLFDVEIIHTDAPSSGSRIGVVVYTFVAKAGLDVNSGNGKPRHS